MKGSAMFRCGSVSLAGLAAALTLSTTAIAQQAVNLTYISGYPPPATFTGAFVNDYVKAVDEQLAKTGKYKIVWNLAHSGQIAKPRGELEAIELGLGDISTLPTPFHLDKHPLYQMPYVTPFTTNDPDFLSRTLAAMEDKFPQYAKIWRSLNQVSISVSSNVDNYVLISGEPIQKLSDLKGIKVGAAGANLPWVLPTGAAGVQTNLADAYNSLSTGIYEAMIAWPQAAGAFKLCEPAPYLLDASFGANSMINLTVNADTYDSLPDEVRKAITDNAVVWHQAQIRYLVDGAGAGIERCSKEFDLKQSTMSPADVKAWADLLPPLALQWAESVDKKGLPGSAILSAYMDAMRAGNQPVNRNWDRE